MSEPMCVDHLRVDLPYAQWHEWAARRAEAGAKQRRCPACRLWLFPEEFGETSA